MTFLATLVNGLSLGSIYALIALGYTMVYGIAKMLNFAHGDIIMIGAFSIFTCITSLKLPAILAILIAIVLCTILGITIEFLAYRPLRKAPPLAVLITAIGVSYFLQNIVLLINKLSNKTTFVFPTNILPDISLKIGSGDNAIIINGNTIFTFIVTAVIMVALTLFINKTKMGKAMRAVSEDKETAELMGISANRTITVTFAIGSALAAVAGLFYGGTVISFNHTLGSMPGIKAFVAAVFGGIGSIPGAMLGGIILGIIEKMAEQYISTSLANAVVFGMLILVLTFKPTGLLGKKINEKV